MSGAGINAYLPGLGALEPERFVRGTHTGFLAGTRIATRNGPMPIEDIRQGDRVINADGEYVPVLWVGRREGDGNDPAGAVRVRQDAFAPGLPARDLVLGPDHGLPRETFLMPARALVNGANCLFEAPGPGGFWHIELSGHDALLAEGLPAESCADGRKATGFSTEGAPRPEYPHFGRHFLAMMTFRAYVEEGPHVTRARAGLISRALKHGWRIADGTWRIEADGMPLSPDDAGNHDIPAGTAIVRLLSDASRPMDMIPGSTDSRRLGLCLAGITINDEAVALDNPALSEGFHGVERDGAAMWRWTDGAAILPGTLFPGPARLCLTFGRLPDVWRFGD